MGNDASADESEPASGGQVRGEELQFRFNREEADALLHVASHQEALLQTDCSLKLFFVKKRRG